jgi:hypothetical protein
MLGPRFKKASKHSFPLSDVIVTTKHEGLFAFVTKCVNKLIFKNDCNSGILQASRHAPYERPGVIEIKAHIRITHIPFCALEIIGAWCFGEVVFRINRAILRLPAFRTPATMRKTMGKRDIKTSPVCASLSS